MCACYRFILNVPLPKVRYGDRAYRFAFRVQCSAFSSRFVNEATWHRLVLGPLPLATPHSIEM